MVNEERLVTLFKELCLINAPALVEAESVAFGRKTLETMGLEVWEDNASSEIGGNANNLIAKLASNVSGQVPSIFFSAHFDTVEPTEGLVIQERDGVLYSDGNTILGADDKAGMAPAIEAIRVIQENDLPHGDIFLLFSVAEEIGLKGAFALKIEELDVDFGYVLDTGPPVGSFVVRTATHDVLEVTIHGKPAHAGKDPEKAVSAIQVAAEAISKMKLGRIGPETTANVGLISGGSANNVVPAEVKIMAEARSTDPAEVDDQIEHMVMEFEAAARKFGATVEIRHDRHYGGYQIADDTPVVRCAVNAAKALGMSGELRTTLGGSDANAFNQKGTPTIVMGTGMEQIHTHDEHVSRKDLVNMARLCLEVVAQTVLSGRD